MSSFHQYANGFQAVPKLGLDRICDLLARLGDPQKKCTCIHIAGTNGKGSVSMFLESILRHAGYRTGRYLSPNLRKVNERIAVGGEDISDEELSALLTELEKAAAETEKAVGIPPTPFEIWTAAAFLHFARKGCDKVVLEVGMGGKYDATNVIDTCECAVITRLGLDHVSYLGNTLREIAENKCGICKPYCPVITLQQEEEAMEAIRSYATALACPLTVAAPVSSAGTEGICEILHYGELQDIHLGLGGLHQMENAALAIECAKLLCIPENAIRQGLKSARHPGRLELLSREPDILYDGGHNPNGITALCAALDRYYPDSRQTVVFACMQDKDIAPSLSLLNNDRRRFVFTTVQNNPRAMSAADLQQRAAEMGIPGESAADLATALELAVAHGDPVIVCGSLYLYGDLPEKYLKS